jgi:Mpv17 / PMP22 family
MMNTSHVRSHRTSTINVNGACVGHDFTTSSAGKGIKHLLHKVWSDYPTAQIHSWKLWPAAALFNYRYVPLNLRVLFINVIALGWTTFLNWSATHNGPKQAQGASDRYNGMYE